MIRRLWTAALFALAAAPALAQVPPNDPFAAAQAGVNWLLPATCDWLQAPSNQSQDCTDGQVKTCLGCHVQGEGTFAAARSASRCYTLPATSCATPGDESLLEFTARFVAGTQRKDCILGRYACNGPRQDSTTRDGRFPELGSIGLYTDCGAKTRRLDIPVTQSVHGGLALAGYSQWMSPRYSSNLLALSNWFVGRQQPDGRWILDHDDRPVSQGDALATGGAVITLAATRPYASPAERAAHDASIARAVAWARAATLVTTQDKTFAMLALVHGGVDPADADFLRIRQDLADDALADGGWAERPGLASNAYATGQALFALGEAGLPSADPAACAGIRWLVLNQQPSGAWSLGAQGVSTDSNDNSAFTATSWGVLGLGSLRRYAVEIAERPAEVVTCDAEVRVPLTIRNVADDPCGLFPRNDVVSILVDNPADDVTSEPPSVAVGVGEEAVVTIVWRRRTTAPGSASATTVVARSDGAAATGCPVEATVPLSVRVPAPDRPYGVALSPELPLVPSCDSETSWTVTVTNAAETPCGSLPSIDVLELSASNDSGDAVGVTPASVTLVSGASQDVTLSWARVGPPRPSGSPSITTLRAISTGARDAGLDVAATLTRTTDLPAPARRFGVALDPDELAHEGCEDALTWPVTVRNLADDPCGAFPTIDTFDLAATHDGGDAVAVVPSSVTLPAGGEAVVQLSWTRLAAPPAPQTPATTTLVAESAGARAAGEVALATAVRTTAVPAPAPPWAPEVTPPLAATTTCDAAFEADFTVRNAADDACGLFPVADTFDIAVTPAPGHVGNASPDSVTLLPGEEAVIRVRVTRTGAPADPGVVAVSGIEVASRGAAAAGTPLLALASMEVTSPPDPVPGAARGDLRVSRTGQDVHLAWGLHPEVIGGWEVVGLDCAERDRCPERPTRGRLDGGSARAAAPAGDPRTTFAGLAAPGEAKLVFLKVRATSPCRGVRGPTCAHDCTDPDRCDRTCP